MDNLDLEQFQIQFGHLLLSEQEIPDDHAIIHQLTAMFGQQSALEEAKLRLSIYRNNVIHSLSCAIGDLYPVVKKLLGEQVFTSLAIEFVRKHPPSEPALVFYGELFPEFLSRHLVESQRGYISDVAKLELFQHQSFNSQDSVALAIEKLVEIAPEQLVNLCFSTRPSVKLLCSCWAIDDIWQDNQHENQQVLNIEQPRYLLIHRPYLEVEIVTLEYSCFEFLDQLCQGKSILQAWEVTVEKTLNKGINLGEDELSGMLSYVLALEVFSQWRDLNAS